MQEVVLPAYVEMRGETLADGPYVGVHQLTPDEEYGVGSNEEYVIIEGISI
jgi:hypothetical protein